MFPIFILHEEKQSHMTPFKSTYKPSLLEKVSYDLKKPALNVGVIGEVSCGKSTFLNALFVEKYGNISKKRTTMGINIYQQETSNAVQNAKSINKEWDVFPFPHITQCIVGFDE